MIPFCFCLPFHGLVFVLKNYTYLTFDFLAIRWVLLLLFGCFCFFLFVVVVLKRDQAVGSIADVMSLSDRLKRLQSST